MRGHFPFVLDCSDPAGRAAEPPLTRAESVVRGGSAARDISNLRMQIDDMLPRIAALEAEQAARAWPAKVAACLHGATSSPEFFTSWQMAGGLEPDPVLPDCIGIDWAEGAKPAGAATLEPMATARKDGAPYLLKFRADLVQHCPTWGGRREVAEQMAGGWVVARHSGTRAGFDPGWFLAGPFGQGLGTDNLFQGWRPLPAVEVAA